MRRIIHVIVPALSLLTIGVEAATIAKGVNTKHSSNDLQVRKPVHERQIRNADFGPNSEHFARNEVDDVEEKYGSASINEKNNTSLETGANRHFTDAASSTDVVTTNSTTVKLVPPNSTTDDSASKATSSGKVPFYEEAMSGTKTQDSSDSQPGNVTISQGDSTGNQTSAKTGARLPDVTPEGTKQDSSSSQPGNELIRPVDTVNKTLILSSVNAPFHVSTTAAPGQDPPVSLMKGGDIAVGHKNISGSDSATASPTDASKGAQVASNIASSDNTPDTSKSSENGTVSKVVGNISSVAPGNGSESVATGLSPSSVPFIGSVLSYFFNLFTGLSGSIPSGQADSSGVGLTGYNGGNGYTKRQDMDTEDADQLAGSDSQDDLSPSLEKASGPFSDAMVVPQNFERRMAKVPRAGGGSVIVNDVQPLETSIISRTDGSSESLKRNEVKSSIADLE